MVNVNCRNEHSQYASDMNSRSKKEIENLSQPAAIDVDSLIELTSTSWEWYRVWT